MNPNELFDQIKKMIEKQDFSAAQKFLEENKDNLGDYFDKAKGLLDGAGSLDGVLQKVKGLFDGK